MRAARFYDHHDIRVEDIPQPQLKPGDGKVLVEVEWSGICGSDLHEYLIGPIAMRAPEPHPSSGETLPLSFGHELCGKVKDPPAGSRFRDGEAVFVDPRVPCGSCLQCKEGFIHCCAILGYVGATTGGGFQEQIAVREENLYPLGNIPLEYAAIVEPLSIVQHAIKEAGITDWPNKHVLILGGGPIGFALSLLLKAHGATNVVVSEPALIRREQVAEFVASTINPLTDDVAQHCRSITGGRGVDIVFDCAGVQIGLESGFDALRVQGLYVNVAVWEKPLTLPSFVLLAKHITVKGVFLFATYDLVEVMRMLNEGKLPGYEKMVTGRISLEDVVKKGFEELVNNKDQHIKIMVTPKPSLLATI